MPWSAERRKLVSFVNPPPADVVRGAVLDYLGESGMGKRDLAAEMGFLGYSSLRHFLRGTYEQVGKDDGVIRARLWQFIQMHPLQDDEDVPRRLIGTRDTRTVIGLCEEARRRKRVVVVEGPPGTSKTTALRWYWAERNRLKRSDAIYLRCWTGIGGVPLLRALCRLLGANTCAHRDGLLRNAARKLKLRGLPVLLIDEAQHLLGINMRGPEAFEQLRDCLDLSGTGCVLGGHFTFLRSLTNGLGADLEQWVSRIDLHEHLHGVQPEELPELERQWFGAELSGNIRNRVIKACEVRDRNSLHRSRWLRGKTKPLSRYLSIRRLRKFFERVEELRELPENDGKKPAALAEGALRLLLQPAGRAL